MILRSIDLSRLGRLFCPAAGLRALTAAAAQQPSRRPLDTRRPQHALRCPATRRRSGSGRSGRRRRRRRSLYESPYSSGYSRSAWRSWACRRCGSASRWYAALAPAPRAPPSAGAPALAPALTRAACSPRAVRRADPRRDERRALPGAGDARRAERRGVQRAAAGLLPLAVPGGPLHRRDVRRLVVQDARAADDAAGGQDAGGDGRRAGRRPLELPPLRRGVVLAALPLLVPRQHGAPRGDVLGAADHARALLGRRVLHDGGERRL